MNPQREGGAVRQGYRDQETKQDNGEILDGEHVYTSPGRQRAVILQNACTQALVALVGGVGVVEVTYDPVPTVRAGKARWEEFEGGMGGLLPGVSAVRARLTQVDGWAVLRVRQVLRRAGQMGKREVCDAA